jgi:tetratricopeptide (TPR) repeat protein
VTIDEWIPSARASARFERIGHEFLAEFLEVERGLRPENLDALFELGHTYTHLGRYEDGLEVDQTLARLMPTNPTVHYNLACSLSLLERIEEALSTMEKSVELGLDDFDLVKDDSDLDNLRSEPRFIAIVKRLTEL